MFIENRRVHGIVRVPGAPQLKRVQVRDDESATDPVVDAHQVGAGVVQSDGEYL